MPHFRVHPETDHYIHSRSSPTGERVDAGEVFAAPAGWAVDRKGCEWIVPIDVDTYKRRHEAQQALQSGDYGRQRSAVADLSDRPAPSGSDKVETRLRELIYGD